MLQTGGGDNNQQSRPQAAAATATATPIPVSITPAGQVVQVVPSSASAGQPALAHAAATIMTPQGLAFQPQAAQLQAIANHLQAAQPQQFIVNVSCVQSLH